MRDVQKGDKIIVFFFSLLYSLNFQSKEQRLSFSKVKQIFRTDVNITFSIISQKQVILFGNL